MSEGQIREYYRGKDGTKENIQGLNKNSGYKEASSTERGGVNTITASDGTASRRKEGGLLGRIDPV